MVSRFREDHPIGQPSTSPTNRNAAATSLEVMKRRTRFANAAAQGTFFEGLVTELSGTRVLVSIVFLLVIGFSFTTSYLISANPDCFGPRGQSRKFDLKHNKLPGEIPMLRSGSALGSVESAVKKAEQLDKTTTQLQCSEEHMTTIRKQLPETNCAGGAPWHQTCSLTKATTSGCYDPFWVREFFASLKLPSTFRSLFVEYNPKDARISDIPIDVLRVGSHDNSKYNLNTWKLAANIGVTCRKPVDVSSATKQAAQSIILMKDEKAAAETRQIVQTLGLSEEEFRVVDLNTGSNTAARKFILQEFPGDNPIHFARVNAAYNFLASSFNSRSLSRVWYLEFVVTWKNEWQTGDLGLLLKNLLPKSGFVCYWAGPNGNLWRINGCWQEHYSFKSWSNVACVNPEMAKPLFEKMEELFLETLAKDQTF